MARKYYFNSSASRPLVRDGREFKFVALSILGGRVSGVFDTEDETDQRILDGAVAAKIGISAMSEEEALVAKKKLTSSPRASSRLSNDVSKPRLATNPAGDLFPSPALTGAGSAESAKQKAAEQKATGEITIPTIMSMVRVGHVKPPQPFAEGERMTIRGKR